MNFNITPPTVYQLRAHMAYWAHLAERASPDEVDLIKHHTQRAAHWAQILTAELAYQASQPINLTPRPTPTADATP